jgi:TRAP-type mannitol/chloroaromatic compound transport system permease small subunit
MTGLPPALLAIVRGIDGFSDWTGRIVALLIFPLVLGVTYEVVVRYAFNAPTIWAYDLSYMLYGSHFMLGAGYALLHKAHIRTDVFYEKWSPRRQGATDAVLYLFFFFPGMLFFFQSGWESAYQSWRLGEVSDATFWRPVVYPLKMCVPAAAVLLFVQGIAEFLKSIHAAFKGEWL